MEISLAEGVYDFYMAKHGKLPTLSEAYSYFNEEANEWAAALENKVALEIEAKELGDLLFTLAGVCLARGIDPDKAFYLVYESNMTKEYTPSGKIVKGDGYIPPDMKQALNKYAQNKY